VSGISGCGNSEIEPRRGAVNVSDIEELREAIRRLYGVEATHIESVPVKETFKMEPIWDGVVEVFELHGHPEAPRAYAWVPKADDPQKFKRPVTILHSPPITSPVAAVRAVIVREFRQRLYGTE
jgi:hypothetical protein